jgi:hypothetical protein
MDDYKRDRSLSRTLGSNPEIPYRIESVAPNFNDLTGGTSSSRTQSTHSEIPYRVEGAAPRHQAMEIFAADPHKAWQRCIRETYARLEGRPQLPNEVLNDAWVVRIPTEAASELITQYEWLGTMAAGTKACYGLRLDKGKGELLGVVCFSQHNCSEEARSICGVRASTVCLARGCCLPHSPTNAASFLIRHACRVAHRKFRWEVFFAYSDEQAGEIGTVYQSASWRYIGKVKQGIKTSFTSPDGKTTFGSYHFNKNAETKFYRLGWDGIEGKYAFLRRLGFTEHREAVKGKYVWFEGPRKAELKASCRFDRLPYPKR